MFINESKELITFLCFKSEVVNKTKQNSFNSKYRVRAIRIVVFLLKAKKVPMKFVYITEHMRRLINVYKIHINSFKLNSYLRKMKL